MALPSRHPNRFVWLRLHPPRPPWSAIVAPIEVTLSPETFATGAADRGPTPGTLDLPGTRGQIAGATPGVGHGSGGGRLPCGSNPAFGGSQPHAAGEAIASGTRRKARVEAAEVRGWCLFRRGRVRVAWDTVSGGDEDHFTSVIMA
jgi:hypothetical protein